MTFHSLKYTYLVKNNIKSKPMHIWIRTTLFLATLCIRELRTGTPGKKFADLRLRNELKNLRIFDLRNKKQNLRAHPPLMINLAGDPS